MLIGLHGKAMAGKDTAFRLLCESPETGLVIRKAFADPLKVSAARALGFDGSLEECIDRCNRLKNDSKFEISIREDGSVVSKGSFSGREFLQWYGTEAHRDVFGQDFWIDASLPKDTLIPASTLVTFTDVRFPNEAERIKECGGEVWEIYRKSLEGQDGHASEQRLPAHLIDQVVYNDGTFEEFQEKLCIALFSVKVSL